MMMRCFLGNGRWTFHAIRGRKESLCKMGTGSWEVGEQNLEVWCEMFRD